MSKKHERLAYRLVDILTKLNNGDRLDVHTLAESYASSIRTIQRDLNERFAFLEWKESGPRYYSLDKAKLGHLSFEDIKRFANFASVQDLFPEIDRNFFQEKLTQSVQVKGFEYEDIRKYQTAFDQLKKAIEAHQCVRFQYTKARETSGKFYELEPYCLLNKNGIWYLIGLDNGQQKTFCFTQIRALHILPETFTVDQSIMDDIQRVDSIYYGSQINEVIIQVAAYAASYFLRRDLLPNQELIRKLDDGGLLLASKNVHEMEIVPIVQYWVPHLRIVSPESLKSRMEETLRSYLNIDGE